MALLPLSVFLGNISPAKPCIEFGHAANLDSGDRHGCFGFDFIRRLWCDAQFDHNYRFPYRLLRCLRDLTVMGRLEGMDKRLEEAAQDLGASPVNASSASLYRCLCPV